MEFTVRCLQIDKKKKKSGITFSSWLLQLNVACNCSCTETNLLRSGSSASCGSGDPRHVTAGGKIAAECIAHSLCLVLWWKERKGEGRVDGAEVKPRSSTARRHRHWPFPPRTIVFCFLTEGFFFFFFGWKNAASWKWMLLIVGGGLVLSLVNLLCVTQSNPCGVWVL